MNLSRDLRDFVSKYADTHEPSEILRNIATICNIELNNIVLHKRLQEDVFELFDKDNEDDMSLKERLSKLFRVISHHSASSCSQFLTEAVIEISADNLTIDDVGNLPTDLIVLDSKQKKRQHRLSSSLMQTDKVQLYYEYNEQTVGSSDRGNKSVIESPCKTINLTISMSHGIGGLDKCVIIDFEMLTAKNSPAENQILIDSGMMDNEPNNFNENDEEGDESGSVQSGLYSVNSDDDNHADINGRNQEEEGSESEGSNASDRDDEGDANDYYNVRVDRDALEQLCYWLNYGDPQPHKKQRKAASKVSSEDSVDSAGERFAYYQENESSQDMLMYLLSVPYVDDSWAVHTLILDHELGQNSESEMESEDENDDGVVDSEAGEE